MRQLSYLGKYWLPIIIWMAIIFYLSSQPRIKISSNLVYDLIVFKSLHITEYAILYFLLFRAIYSIKAIKISLQIKFILAMIIAFLYALTDEFHQLYIPTRSGRLTDIFIDLLGIILMYTLIKSNLNVLKKYL